MDEIKNLRIGKIPLFSILIACFILMTCGSEDYNIMNAAEMNSIVNYSIKTEHNLSSDKPDFGSIDEVINTIYESITFGAGETPNMMRFRSICAPNAPFIRITRDGVDKLDLESFLSSFQERVEAGTLKSFYEGEIFRKTHRYGSIAQVFSTYKKGMNSEDPESFVRGINSIQLYYDNERWWISCIMWEDENPSNPIPNKYLR